MRSPLFDARWVALQIGRSLSDREAADAYLRDPRELSPHPLFAIDWARGGLAPLVWYIVSRDDRPPTHPLIDVDRLIAEHPTAARHQHGPLAGWLATAEDDSIVPTAAWMPPVTLGEIRRCAEDAVARHRSESSRASQRRVGEIEPSAEVRAAPARRTDGSDPAVSIIMPTWNRAAHLRRAVESVQRQTWQDWELIVVDDGSDDDTPAVVEGLRAFDVEDRIVFLTVEHGGVCRARNAGIEVARGRYVAFLDSDNTWRPRFLAEMLAAFADHPEWSMAHAVLAFESEGRSFYRDFEGTYDDLRLLGNHIDLNVLVVQRQALSEVGGFDPSLRRAVDYDLILKLARNSPLHLVPTVGADYTSDEHDAFRISVREPSTWNSFVRGRHVLDWEAAAARPAIAGLTSVVVAMDSGSGASFGRWVHDLQITASGHDLELVVAGVGMSRPFRVLVGIFEGLSDRVRVVPVWGAASFGLTANLGAQAARGGTLVVSRADTHVDAAGVEGLVGALTSGVDIAQPAVVDSLGLLVSAGAAFAANGIAVPLLAGHSPGDADRAAEGALPGPLAGVIATSSSHFHRMRGFHEVFDAPLADVDLGLRSSGASVLVAHVRAERPAGELATTRTYREQASLLSDRWNGRSDELRFLTQRALSRCGLHWTGVSSRPFADADADGLTGADTLPYSTVVSEARLNVKENPPRLRWTIDHAAPSGKIGETWGDTHFARSLAGALLRQGQYVCVDNRDLRNRPTRDLDDVVLVLRGLDRVVPRPGQLSLQWIISHPDMVGPDELASFDAVFAASISWSREQSRRTGVNVQPLLQCTDSRVFHPDGVEADSGPPVLFVGNSRGVYRPAVKAALAARLDLTLYGNDWKDFVPAESVAAEYVPNAELGALYGSAGVTLNDHWEDMRRDGFLSNRLFDAAACGARVLTDRIAGVEEVFGDQVQVFDDEQDLRRIVGARDEHFPDTPTRLALARKVAAEHSFDRRAEQLVSVASEAWVRRR